MPKKDKVKKVKKQKMKVKKKGKLKNKEFAFIEVEDGFVPCYDPDTEKFPVGESQLFTSDDLEVV